MLVDLLFERFVSTERDEPPDIDVDFEHERREEVMQYLYEKYGRHRCALTATVTTYRSKGAIREVCKAFGLSSDIVDALNGLKWGYYDTAIDPESVRKAGLDPTDPAIAMAMVIASELVGFPRHPSIPSGRAFADRPTRAKHYDGAALVAQLDNARPPHAVRESLLTCIQDSLTARISRRAAKETMSSLPS